MNVFTINKTVMECECVQQVHIRVKIGQAAPE